MRLGILIGALGVAVLGLGIALAIVVANDGSGETKTVTRTITRESTVTTPTSGRGDSEGAGARRLESFLFPSKNIGCALVGGAARCDIRRRSWKPPPKPADCDVDWGQGISVGRTGAAHFVCAGDTAYNAAAPILAYGEDARSGGFLCKSRPSGVTCESVASSRGFFISRKRYRLF